MTQATADYSQSSHMVQQAVDETVSPEDDLELVGKSETDNHLKFIWTQMQKMGLINNKKFLFGLEFEVWVSCFPWESAPFTPSYPA